MENFIHSRYHHLVGPIFKKLLDEVFVISRIMEVEVSGYQPSQRARLITLTETLII